MKTILLLVFFCVVGASVLIACDPSIFHHKEITGSGTLKTENRALTGFKGVDVSGAIEVKIVAQKDFSVEVEADDNIINLITTEVRGGVLHIYQAEDYSITDGHITVRVALPELTSLEVSGASKAVADQVKTHKLSIDISGASKATIHGTAEELRSDISGASSLTADEFQAKAVHVEASGASRGSVFALESLEADASGASNISYKGEPKNLSQETSGASSIHRR